MLSALSPLSRLSVTHNVLTPFSMLLGRRPAGGGLSACPKIWRFAGIRPSADGWRIPAKRFLGLDRLPRVRKAASCRFPYPGLISETPLGYLLEAFPSWKRAFYCIAIPFPSSVKILWVKLSRVRGEVESVFSAH
jgi:hypothetical protein